MAMSPFGPRTNPLQAGMTAASASQGPAYASPTMSAVSARAVQPGQLSFLQAPIRGATGGGQATGVRAGTGQSTAAGLVGGTPGTPGMPTFGATGGTGLPGSPGGNIGGFDATAIANVAPNPYQTRAYDSMNTFLQGLPEAQDRYATDALARQRDINAGAMADVRAGAGGRGFGTGTGISQTLQGKQARTDSSNLANMGSDLANAGRGMTLTGLTSQGQLGSNIASNQVAGQNALSNFYSAQAQAQLAAWTAQNNAAQQQWDNFYRLYNTPAYQANMT